jgi:23S rRNA (cytosine1962-C5)-methyltransferase
LFLLILFEDEDLLVINKPAGLNTHAPSPYAGEGIYDWLRHREPRWVNLATIHRLDKETSGVMVFSKSALGNRSLTEQFAQRKVGKRYVLQTDRPVPRKEITVRSTLVRLGDKYVGKPGAVQGEVAETRFKLLNVQGSRSLVEAQPLTGRTHQIRVHATEQGFPILGDTLYGGTGADRVCLHAQELAFHHPRGGESVTFKAPVDFSANSRLLLRQAIITSEETDAYRLVHGAADQKPGWYVDRLGEFLLSQAEGPATGPLRNDLMALLAATGARGAYHKRLVRQIQKSSSVEMFPEFLVGEKAGGPLVVKENGLRFRLSFEEGYSVGLFLDQRDNRRRFIEGHVAAEFPLFANAAKREVLNTFAYTCGFSVCAAVGGARVTSLDLSRKYLDWGKENFKLNGLDPAAHDFIYGDAIDWMQRLKKKERSFDAIILDPPTFSQSKESGVFRVEKDLSRLITLAIALLRPNGVLLVSTNAAKWKPEEFVHTVKTTAGQSRRKVLQMHYVPQPPDFPITRSEPGYLKTVWVRMA